MTDKKVIEYLIQTQSLTQTEINSIFRMSKEDIIYHLIGLKGGFLFRAYLLERLMELIGGPRDIAVPSDIYKKVFPSK